jgi:hypothetical protein
MSFRAHAEPFRSAHREFLSISSEEQFGTGRRSGREQERPGAHGRNLFGPACSGTNSRCEGIGSGRGIGVTTSFPGRQL